MKQNWGRLARKKRAMSLCGQQTVPAYIGTVTGTRENRSHICALPVKLGTLESSRNQEHRNTEALGSPGGCSREAEWERHKAVSGRMELQGKDSLIETDFELASGYPVS